MQHDALLHTCPRRLRQWSEREAQFSLGGRPPEMSILAVVTKTSVTRTNIPTPATRSQPVLTPTNSSWPRILYMRMMRDRSGQHLARPDGKTRNMTASITPSLLKRRSFKGQEPVMNWQKFFGRKSEACTPPVLDYYERRITPPKPRAPAGLTKHMDPSPIAPLSCALAAILEFWPFQYCTTNRYNGHPTGREKIAALLGL